MKDGGLRPLFRYNLRQWQWTSIETAGTSSGVPDSEFCSPTGNQGWIEFKRTTAFNIQFQEFQPAWLDRRCRYGGNAWIAVRRIPSAKKYNGADELWLIHGSHVFALDEGGLQNVHAISWNGGPSNWNWDQIAKILTLEQSF